MDLREEVDEIIKEIKEIRCEDINQLNMSVMELLLKNKNLNKAVTKLAKNNDELYAEISELQRRISELEEELDHYKGINNKLLKK